MKYLIPVSILTAALSLVLRHYGLTLASDVVLGAAAVAFVVGLAGGEKS